MMIKKITLAAMALLGCCFTVQAQLQANSILIGGQLSYNKTDISFHSEEPKEQTSDGSFNISVGKALRSNAVFGITLGYAPSSITNYFNGSFYENGKLKGYNIGIFYRQYKMLAKDLYFFTEAGAGFNTFKQTTSDTTGANAETIKQNGGQITLMPGLAYKITKRLFLEIVIPDFVNLQYTATTDELLQQNQSAKLHQLMLSTSLNSNGLNFLGVGFRFVL